MRLEDSCHETQHTPFCDSKTRVTKRSTLHFAAIYTFGSITPHALGAKSVLPFVADAVMMLCCRVHPSVTFYLCFDTINKTATINTATIIQTVPQFLLPLL